MSRHLEELRELISHTKDILLEEYQLGDFIYTDEKTKLLLSVWQRKAEKNPLPAAYIPSAKTSVKVPSSSSVPRPLAPVVPPQFENPKQTQRSPTASKVEKTPEVSEKKNFELEPVKEGGHLDLGEVADRFKKTFPHVPFREQVPAKPISTVAIAIVIPSLNAEEKRFIETVAEAITARLQPALIVEADSGDCKAFLAAMKLLIMPLSLKVRFADLPQKTIYMQEVSDYPENPSIKKALWQAVCIACKEIFQ